MRPSDGGSPLRIALVAPPFYEIPPRGYGGTEAICAWLADALVARGHEVTVIAAGERHVSARFVSTLREPPGEAGDMTTYELLHAARAAAAIEALEPDIVHEHTRMGPLTARARAAPTLATIHAAVQGPESEAELWQALGRSVPLVALSDSHRRGAPELNWVDRIYNGLPVERYPLETRKQDYLLCLGRISPYKGVVPAIEAARAVGRPLVLAGSWSTPGERAYFEAEVRPRLGPGIEWVGEVGGDRKLELLKHARCVVFPVAWNEPFGLVMIEAMACGTPVVALRAGSVPEVVADRVTGVVCDDAAALPAAIESVGDLSPHACRERVVARFSAARMAQHYERRYRALAG